MTGRLAKTIYVPADESRYTHLGLSSSYAQPDGDPKPGRAENQARFRTEPEARTASQWLDTGVIDGAEEYGLLGFESVVNYGRAQLTGEYLNLWLNREPGFGESLHFHGGYLQLAWFLTDHYQPWNRQRGILKRVKMLDPECGWRPALQLAVRWSFLDLSSNDVRGGVGESITSTLNWYWTSRSRLSLNAIFGQVTNHEPVDGQTAGDYVALGTRVMVDF